MPRSQPTPSALIARVLDRVVNAVEEAEWLDGPADQLAAVVSKVSEQRWARDLLSGTFLGHPLHPLAVTVPIGAWSTAAVLDVLHLRAGARAAVGVGVLTAPVAVVSGLSDWASTTGASRRVGLAHAAMNAGALSLYTTSYLVRRIGMHRTGFLLTLPAMGLLGLSGWFGGHLIYARGVGVDVTVFEEREQELQDVAAEADVQEGELTVVDVGGQPVLLTRHPDGHVVAMSDRCTHRGGPLHEGSIQDGAIQCPWHGSVFDLDGQLCAGPATRPQPLHRVEVADGRVRVGGPRRP